MVAVVAALMAVVAANSLMVAIIINQDIKLVRKYRLGHRGDVHMLHLYEGVTSSLDSLPLCAAVVWSVSVTRVS